MDDLKHTSITAMLESIAEQDGLIHTLDWRVIQAALIKAGDAIQEYESKLVSHRKALQAMVDDGWLHCGPEGPSDAQKLVQEALNDE